MSEHAKTRRENAANEKTKRPTRALWHSWGVRQKTSRYAGKRPFARVIFAHGAGAGQKHPFMVAFAKALAKEELDVLTFDFPYMAKGKKTPDRAPVLEASFEDVIAKHPSDLPLVLAGKSMGGRIASHIANRTDARALVFFGYPLHPPGKPEKRRDAHLPSITIPMLFVQGERDEFGDASEITPLAKSLGAKLHLVKGGDHSLRVRKMDGVPQEDVDRAIIRAVVSFVRSVV